jgi:hypothetical protein
MHSNDFFHEDAETALTENFVAAGAVCSLATNCAQLLDAARGTFLPAGPASGAVDISMRFWVEDGGSARPPWPKPYVRGLGYLVFAGFDVRSSVLVDLRTQRIIGRFSAAMAADAGYWKTVVFPMLLSIIGGSVGLVELHASCVAKDGMGLLLAGPSRSGKSTLAMAFARLGFHVLSDDRTFCSLKHGTLTAWGLPRPLKLRREAAAWFDGLRGMEPTDVQNGERVFHLELEQRTLPFCRPRMLVFLERRQECGFSMTAIGRSEARSRIERELLVETDEAACKQAGPLDELLSLPPCLLRYGGTPADIAGQLAESIAGGQSCQESGGRW